jgi:uncharacterized cupin superfamily protein
MGMKIILDDKVSEKAVRADLAWELFFGSKTSMPKGHGEPLLPFANWFWDELGNRAGRLNKYAKGEVRVAISALEPDGLDFVLRLVSFWADEVYVSKGGVLSENMWRGPIANVLDDNAVDQAERSLTAKNDSGSVSRFLMPLLGPGRAFFRVRVVEKNEIAARFHSHSHVDEYYLILEGRGTLRYNGKEAVMKPGDLIGKPAGPDAATQLIADHGERLRILDMEVWHERAQLAKDIIVNPDHKEMLLSGQGWNAIIPEESLISPDEFFRYYNEGYTRKKDGGWVPSKNRGHRKVREK